MFESIIAVNNGLADFKGVVIFTTHDHEIMQTVANRIIKITNTKAFDKMITYDEFIDLEMVLLLQMFQRRKLLIGSKKQLNYLIQLQVISQGWWLFLA